MLRPLLVAALLVSALPAWSATKKPAAPPPPPPIVTYRDLLDRIDQGKATGMEVPRDGRDPLMDKLVRWYLWTRNKAPGTVPEITQFIRDNPDWPGQLALRRRVEDLIVQDVSNERVLEWFTTYPPASRDGKLRLAEAYRATGRDADSTTLIRRIWIEDQFAPDEEERFLAAYGYFLRPADFEAKLDRDIWRDNLDSAQRQMRRVGAPARLAAEARLKLRAAAPDAILAVGNVPAERQGDAGLLFDRIRWARKAGNDAEARAVLAKAPAELVRPDLWWVERELQIRRTLAEGDAATAYQLASVHNASGGSEFADAEFLAGFIALRFLNDPARASRHFEALYGSVQTPISKSRGAYWNARARIAAKDPAGAAKWYAQAASWPTSFYGQLAIAETMPQGAAGTGAATVARFSLPADPRPPKQLKDAFDKREPVRIARKLNAMGAFERIDPFVMRLADTAPSPEALQLVAGLAHDVGRADLAVAVARRAWRDGIVLVDAGYPRLEPVVGPMPEPALVHGLIRQESSFSSAVVSKVGARGLMQLMPGTAKEVAAKLGMPFVQDRLTGDSSYNLALGQAFLAQTLNGFDGAYVLAVAAYNAGPARVRQWLVQNGDPRTGEVDPIDWIERIPFSETRNYVQRVLEATQVYRVRLRQPAPPPATAARPDAGRLTNWCLADCVQSTLSSTN